MKQKLAPLPRSCAKTALGLLGDVKRAILADPKRLDMGVYTACRSVEVYPKSAPACGTVGCFAGWVSLLSGGGFVGDDDHARTLLGHDLNYQTVRLPDYLNGLETSSYTRYVFNGGSGDGISDLRSGTPAYARAVVRRIDRFIRFNYKALCARRMQTAKREARHLAAS